MKKVAKPAHAVIGTLGKRERVPSMDKDGVGAILEQRCALTCLKATVPTIIPTETKISTDNAISTETTTDTEISRATVSTDIATSTAIQCMEKSTECSENAITNTGQTRIAVE